MRRLWRHYDAWAVAISVTLGGNVPRTPRSIAAAVVGGTASTLSGGKFANGAMTGAFSRIFNDDAHPDGKDEATWDDVSDEQKAEFAKSAFKEAQRLKKMLLLEPDKFKEIFEIDDLDFNLHRRAALKDLSNMSFKALNSYAFSGSNEAGARIVKATGKFFTSKDPIKRTVGIMDSFFGSTGPSAIMRYNITCPNYCNLTYKISWE